jgi:hypothetical protein
MVQKLRFTVDYSVRNFFFDRRKVTEALSDAEQKSLSMIGAYVRQSARRDVLTRRSRVSRPGESPSVHSSDRVASLRNILFAYVPEDHAVIIGPVRLNQVNMMNTGSSYSVPQILEFGGTVIIHEEQYSRAKDKSKWFRSDLRVGLRPFKRYRTRAATYQPRPFMSVALQKNIDSGTIRNAWRGSVVGGRVA